MKIRIGKKKYRLKKPVLVILAFFLMAFIFVPVFILMNQNPEEVIEEVNEEIDKDYNVEENKIEVEIYDKTILAKTDEADDEYISETLFLGDSNTARFLKTKDSKGKTYVTKDNSIGVVGMGIDAISTLPCLDLSTGRVTMVKAVSILQPRRVIITFGTNNLSGNSTDTTSFISRYEKQIKKIEEAYPSVDIIINSIPPVGKNRTYTNVSMTQIDAYNKAIVEMCDQNGWKYLNSSEALKDAKTGYAKEGYMLSDGLHLSALGIDELFKYIRTHSYITDDDRPKPLAKIPTIIGVPAGLIQTNPLNNEKLEESIIEETAQTITCGPNAWGDANGCYCNGGYEGDPYQGCTLIPTPTSTPNCGNDAYFDQNKNQCVCNNPNAVYNASTNSCEVVQTEEPTAPPTETPDDNQPGNQEEPQNPEGNQEEPQNPGSEQTQPEQPPGTEPQPGEEGNGG